MAQQSLDETCQKLWEACLDGWDADVNRVVTWAEFDSFLLLCGFRGPNTRTTYRRALKAKGFIDYREGPANRGNGKNVTIYSKPNSAVKGREVPSSSAFRTSG